MSRATADLFEPSSTLSIVGAGALAAAAAVLGTATATHGAPTLIGLAAAVGIAAAVVNPYAGFLVFLVTVPMESLTTLGAGFTGTRLLGMVIFVAWAARKVVRRESWTALLGSGILPIAAAFILIIAASTFWALYPERPIAGAVQITQMAALAALILDLTDSWRRMERMARALVLGAVGTALITIFQAVVGGARRAGEGVAGGVNGTAIMLITVLPLGFFLIGGSRSRLWRVIGAIHIAASIVAVILTYSRMNFLLLPPVVFAMLWPLLKSPRGRIGFVATTVVAAVVLTPFVPWSRVVDRVRTIGPYVAATFLGRESDVGHASGRGYHIQVAFEIAADHPVLGVGYGNYGRYFLYQYQFQVPGAHKLFLSPRSPHSSHAGILADLGIVGFAVWLLLLGAGLRPALRAWHRFRATGPPSVHLLTTAVLIGLSLHVFAYGWYQPNQREKILWVMLGLSGAAARIMFDRRTLAAGTTPAATPRELRPRTAAYAVLPGDHERLRP